MTSWYYAIGQQLRGPFDEAVFRDLIRDGTGNSATSCSPFTLSVILKKFRASRRLEAAASACIARLMPALAEFSAYRRAPANCSIGRFGNEDAV